MSREWGKIQRRGEHIMTIEKARNLSAEEFSKLSEDCKGFNDEVYRNHGLREPDETFGEFLSKGSKRIKDDPMIRGKLV